MLEIQIWVNGANYKAVKDHNNQINHRIQGS